MSKDRINEVAKALGCTWTTIYHARNCTRPVSLNLALRLEEYLGVPVRQLVDGDSPVEEAV